MAMKGGYVAVGAVALLLIGGWVGAFYKDQSTRHNESLLKAQAVALQEQLVSARQATADALQRVDKADTARLSAEQIAKDSAAKADAAYASYVSTRNVVTDSNAPVVLDALPVVEAEHSARLDCTQALQAADSEIGALKDATLGLTEQVRLVTERADTSDAALEVVTEDRDTQLRRKKIWRGVACALSAIGTAALLF